jgi:sugar lactone lactonase YvrE
MADVMLSYASVEREEARALAEAIRAENRTVWMDAAVRESAGQELPGIPGGQRHWDTICAAIDEAATFVVLETPAWHRSEYCLRELDYARKSGKRVAVVRRAGPEPRQGCELEAGAELTDVVAAGRTDDVVLLIRELMPGDEIARAHARLIAELNAPGRSRATRGQIADARLLATADLGAAGVVTTSRLAEQVADLLRTGRRRRRSLQMASTGVLTVLFVLTTVAVLAGLAAGASRNLARAKADYASALSLAQQSRGAVTTNDALTLATRGVELDWNDATVAALRAAQASSYRSTVRMASGTPRAAVVSDDGRAALVVQGLALFLVDAPGGRVQSVRLERGASPAVAVSPAGDIGYVVDTAGAMSCIDMTTGGLTPTPQIQLRSLHVDPDGTLWWLTVDGRVYHADGCPTSFVDPVTSGLAQTLGFLVVSSTRTLFVLTTTGTVDIYRLPDAAAALQAPISTITVTDIAPDGKDFGSKEPDPNGSNSITRCGDRIHVVAAFKHALSASSHVSLTTDGEVVGSRSAHLAMYGVGCVPNGQAWAAPLNTGNAVALPSAGRYPADEIDNRDEGSRTVIANSPDASHTVVVHTDGRVDVLAVTDVRWSDALATAEVAVPVAGAVITVDADGSVRSWTEESGRTVAKLGGEPVLTTIPLADRALVAVGDRVVALNADGVVSSATFPAPVDEIQLASGAEVVVVSGEGFTSTIPTDLSGAPALLHPPPLADNERIGSVTVIPGRVIWGTTYGRILVQEGDRVVAQTDMGVAGAVEVRSLPDHDVVAVGGSGLLARYSPDLELRSSRLFGPTAVSLAVSADGSVLLVGLTGHYSVWAVDTATLQPITKLSTLISDLRLADVSADGSMATFLTPASVSPDHMARIVRTSLGGLDTQSPQE